MTASPLSPGLHIGTNGDNDAGHWGDGNGQEILLSSDLRLDFLGHWVTKDLHKLDV